MSAGRFAASAARQATEINSRFRPPTGHLLALLIIGRTDGPRGLLSFAMSKHLARGADYLRKAVELAMLSGWRTLCQRRIAAEAPVEGAA